MLLGLRIYRGLGLIEDRRPPKSLQCAISGLVEAISTTAPTRFLDCFQRLFIPTVLIYPVCIWLLICMVKHLLEGHMSTLLNLWDQAFCLALSRRQVFLLNNPHLLWTGLRI